MLANKDAYIAQLRAFLNKGRYKFAAIFGGIAADDEDLVRVCLSQPEELIARDENGYSPLTYAAKCDSTEIVHMLVRKGVSPNESDDQHRTALSVACSRGNVKMVQRLLSYGALVNESQSLVDALLSNTNVPESSQIQILDMLIAANLHIDPPKWMIKMVTARRTFAMIKRYIPRSDAIDPGQYGCYDLVEKLFAYVDCDQLLAYFEPIQSKIQYGFGKAFVDAAKMDDIVVIDKLAPLIKTSFLVRAICEKGIQLAAVKSRYTMLYLLGLLKEQPDYSMYDSSCKNPLVAALDANDMELAQVLYNKGFKPTNDLCRCACEKDVHQFAWVFERTRGQLRTQLYMHMFSRVPEGPIFDLMIAYALDHGAREDPNFAKCVQQQLFYVCALDRPSLVKKYIDLGADPSLSDEKGRNAFDIAVKHNQQNVIRVLLAHGLPGYQDTVE